MPPPGFATSGCSYDVNLSPNNQSFTQAVAAVMNRNPATQGTSFVNIVVTGTATINDLQVTTATIATVNIGTATITQLVAGTGSFSRLSASGTTTLASLLAGTATTAGLTVLGTATPLIVKDGATVVFEMNGKAAATVQGYGPKAAVPV
jgi:hypothetical protein